MDEVDKATPYAIAVEEPKPAAQAVEAEFTTGKWEVGLCGCCTHCVPNCCMVSFCPCVSIAQVSARLGFMTYSTALLISLLLILCTGGAGGIVFVVWIWMVATHTKSYKPGNCDFGPQETLAPYQQA
ncbi:hypothetical protein PHYBOEH_004126 [Phytophthora boehmeriae]|uniref:Transmembrane protein n=1 Tax=Phytophthora boehmeriae TaxID=109152 RepID=A0A8T1WTX4_9STRA|nr:hypothetical protein PHYBOEH_004126 [Phytophthora boehmeriae]